jgi:hypothetical protein
MPAIMVIYGTEAEINSRETALVVISAKTVFSTYKLKYDAFTGIVLSGWLMCSLLFTK